MNKLWLFLISRWLVRTVCRIYFRIEFEGVERVPPSGALIIAPNHVSYLDPLWVSIPISRPLRYMTWDRMTRLPVIGPLMLAYGAFPVNVDRSDRAALKASLEQLNAGGGLMVFPEGARTRTGRLEPFKPGVIRLSLDTDAPIVPVTIVGGYRAFAPHHFFPRPFKVKIVYHDPIQLTPPVSHAEWKHYQQEQAARLQWVVASALPPESLPIGQSADPRLNSPL
ncbi:MAG: 1-acyl-sn-glycerol-3-phosphate acyltransferase [Acidobacteriota bacterium]|nr:1-acyl-sn-glycerol-3-phosphate acyltransferase [Acidobacteriota bacterium]